MPEKPETAELAVDTTNGNLYTKLDNGSVVHLNDAGEGGDGTGSSVHIGEAPPAGPQEGQQWMEVPADGDATMWIYDGDKWLQQPGGKDGADGQNGADGNIADATEQGVIATWDNTSQQWTPNDNIIVYPSGTFTSSGNAEITGQYLLQRESGNLFLSIARYWDGINGSPLNGTKGDILAIGNTGGDGLVFANGDAERMRINADGKVITGDNIVIQDKAGGVGALTELTFVNSDVVTGQSGRAAIQAERVSDPSGGFDGSTLSFITTNGGDTAEFDARMTIDANGRVDITGSLYVNGTPKIGTVDLIKAFSKLRDAVKDEETVESLKESITNCIGGLIEEWEAMQSPATQEIEQ